MLLTDSRVDCYLKKVRLTRRVTRALAAVFVKRPTVRGVGGLPLLDGTGIRNAPPLESLKSGSPAMNLPPVH